MHNLYAKENELFIFYSLGTSLVLSEKSDKTKTGLSELIG